MGEWEALQAAVLAEFERVFVEAHAEADHWFLYGSGTRENRGFLPVYERPATPAELALAILTPHLANEPLYRQEN